MTRSMLTRRVVVPIVAAGAVAAASIGTAQALAHHGAAAKRSVEHFYITELNFPSTGLHDVNRAIVNGPIVGGGKDSTKGAVDTLHLAKGTLRIKHPNKQSTFKAHVNPSTCFATFTITGKYTVTGTGAYRNASGHGTYSGIGRGVLSRTKSGSCSERAEPAPDAVDIVAHGPLTLK